MSPLLFAGKSSMAVESTEQPHSSVTQLGRVCERRKVGVNVGKSKKIVVGRRGVASHTEVEMTDGIGEVVSFLM